MNWEWLGLVAGAFTSSSFLPQIIKGYKTKKLDDLSYMLCFLINIGMIMWLIYGIAISSTAIIVANIFSIAFVSTLIVMKYRYSKK